MLTADNKSGKTPGRYRAGPPKGNSMVVCSCRDIRDSHFNSKEELAIRVLADDYCCGECLEEFLFDGPEIGSIDEE